MGLQDTIADYSILHFFCIKKKETPHENVKTFYQHLKAFQS